MHPDVQKLLSVQEVDQRIASLRKDLVSIPAEREQRQGKLDSLRQTAERAHAELQSAEVEVRTNETGLKQQGDEIKKLQERLNSVKNNAEYQATLLSIEAVKKQIDEQENEGLELIQSVESLREKVGAADAALAEEEKVFAEFETEANALVAEREGQVGEVQGDRDRLAGEVPPELLGEYERMFEARSHLVVCPVEGETCTGCYMSIPPNLQVKLRAGSAVVKCDSCQRILYYAE